MTSATVGGTTTTYGYDGDGNRLSAAVGGGSTTSYLWDVNEPLPLLALERIGSTTLRDYSYGTDLNSMTSGGSNYFYLQDAYGSVANLTSATGAAEWTYATDPFGTATATQNDPSAPTNVMRFDGQLLDPISGLYDLRARVMDASLGRFLASALDGAPAGPSWQEPKGIDTQTDECAAMYLAPPRAARLRQGTAGRPRGRPEPAQPAGPGC